MIENIFGVFMSIVFCALIVMVYWMMWGMGQIGRDDSDGLK